MTKIELVGGPADGKQEESKGTLPESFTVRTITGHRIFDHYYKRTDYVVNDVVLYKWKGTQERLKS